MNIPTGVGSDGLVMGLELLFEGLGKGLLGWSMGLQMRLQCGDKDVTC